MMISSATLLVWGTSHCAAEISDGAIATSGPTLGTVQSPTDRVITNDRDHSLQHRLLVMVRESRQQIDDLTAPRASQHHREGQAGYNAACDCPAHCIRFAPTSA